jgi:hypothetical protein
LTFKEISPEGYKCFRFGDCGKGSVNDVDVNVNLHITRERRRP